MFCALGAWFDVHISPLGMLSVLGSFGERSVTSAG